MPRENPGHVYSVVFAGVSMSASQDLFEITAGSGLIVVIRKISVAFDVEETSEKLAVRLVRGVGATAGSGGTTKTPARLKGGARAATSVVTANNTTKMTAGTGTITTLERTGADFVNGYLYEPTDLQAIEVAAGEILTCEVVTTPSGALVTSGTMIFEEILQ